MPDIAIELHERARIQQLDESLAREELALLALALDRRLGTGVLGLVAELLQLVESLVESARLVRCRYRRSNACLWLRAKHGFR